MKILSIYVKRALVLDIDKLKNRNLILEYKLEER